MYWRNFFLYCILTLLLSLTVEAQDTVVVSEHIQPATPSASQAPRSGGFRPIIYTGTPMSPVALSTPAVSTSSSHTSTVPIIPAVVGGIVGLAMIFLLARMSFNIFMTPRVDRLALIRSRHKLDTEVAQLQREQLEQRVITLFAERAAAPPPYEPSPSYSGTADVKPGYFAGQDHDAKADNAV